MLLEYFFNYTLPGEGENEGYSSFILTDSDVSLHLRTSPEAWDIWQVRCIRLGIVLCADGNDTLISMRMLRNLMVEFPDIF